MFFFFFFPQKSCIRCCYIWKYTDIRYYCQSMNLQLHRARWFLVWMLSKWITPTRHYPCLPEVEGKHALIRQGPPAQLLSQCMMPLRKLCCIWERGRKCRFSKDIPERKRWRKAETEGGPSSLVMQKTEFQPSPVSCHHPADVQWPLVVHPANLHLGAVYTCPINSLGKKSVTHKSSA